MYTLMVYSAWDMYRPRAVCTSSGSVLGSTYNPCAVHIPCTVKTLTCTDRPYKANHWISFGTRMSVLYSMYDVPSVPLE